MWNEPMFWILILSVIAIVPCQLLLCFKVRSILVRLLPLAALVISFAFLFYKAVTVVDGWSGLGYLLLAFFAAILFGVCALCWAIFGIVRYVKKRRSKTRSIE